MPGLKDHGAAVAAAGAVSGALVALSAAVLVRRRKNSSDRAALPSSRSTTSEVAEWLRKIGVSERTVGVFQGEQITGSSLLQLSDQDIVLLSATSSDAETVLRALRASAKPGALDAFLKETQEMFVELASARSDDSETSGRLVHRVLYAFKSFQLLSSDLQSAALLPLSRQATAALAVVQKSAESSREVAATPEDSAGAALPPGMTPERLQATIQSLHEMLDQCLEMSRMGLEQLAAPEATRIAEGILGRIERVEEIAAALPKPVAGPLEEKCRAVRSALSGQRAEAPAAVAAPETSMQQLLLRLRELFTAVKSGSVLRLAPEERVRQLTAMLEELRSIQAAADAHEASNEKQVIGSVSKTVGELLEQMVSLAKEEQSLRGRGAETGSPDEGGDNLEAAVRDLGKVFNFLNSADFQSIPEEERFPVVQKLAEDVQQLKARIEGSSNPGKDQVLSDLVTPLQELMEAMAPGAVAEYTNHFEDVKSVLDDILRVISSPDFVETEDMEVKERTVTMVRSQLAQIASTFDVLSGDERSIAERIVQRINLALSQAVPEVADIQNQSNVAQDILQTIQKVMDLIQSPTFLTCSHDERCEGVHDALVTLSSSRDAAVRIGVLGNPLVVFIDDVVQRLENICDSDGNGNDDEPHVVELVGTDEAEPEVSEDEEKAVRERLFSTLTALSHQIEERKSRNIPLSPAELSKFRNVGAVTVGMKNISPAEQAVLNRFSTALNGASQDDPRITSFITTLEKVHERISGLPSLESLVPLTTRVQHIIAAADQCDVPWRHHPQATETVTRLLAAIEKFKSDHSDEAQLPSVQERVEAAVTQIKENPPKSMQEILPYISILRSVCANGVDENMECVQELRAAVEQAVMEAQAQLSNASENVELHENLLAMSNALREDSLPEHILDEFEDILDQVTLRPQESSVSQAIESIREQIQLQRQQLHDAEEDEEDEEGEEGEEASTSDEGSGDSTGDKKSDEKTAAPRERESEVKEDEGEQQEDPSVLERDLSLFPRMESHLALPPEKLASTCTPFDLSFMKLVLNRLASSKSITDEALKQRIIKSRENLGLILGEAGENPTVEVTNEGEPLAVTAKETEREDGTTNVHFVVHTEEERKDHPANPELLSSLNANAQHAEQPSKADRASWDGQSLAILLNDAGNNKEDAKSVDNELHVLDDALVHNGFDVVHASPALGSRGAFETMLRDAVKANPSRLFVYNSSGTNSDQPRTLTFGDGSSMNLEDIIGLTGPAERTVIANCHPNRLDMNYRHKDHQGPAVAVELTPKAAENLQNRRCAIFDGIFTPIVAEFLNNDRAETMCPEDLMRRLVSVTSSRPCVAGMRGGRAGVMGYFC